jgi:hypothetical protein
MRIRLCFSTFGDPLVVEKASGERVKRHPAVSRLVSHFVRYSKRYLRWLAMIKCFVDDSGNHDPDPYFILAGWTGTIGTWDQFADDWDKELAKPKPIDYYKHSEAAGGSGCFEKFSIYERAMMFALGPEWTFGVHLR